MPTRLDLLKKPISICHRSSDRITRITATIFLDDKTNSIDIQFEKAASGESDYKIAVPDVQLVKTKEFMESEHKKLFMLSIHHGSGGLRHTSFQFDTLENRNAWDHGLRSLMSGAVQSAKGTEVKVPGAKYVPIKAIALQNPRPGQLVSIGVDLGGKQVDLVVSEKLASSDDCKRLATEFVEQNVILPTETTSLYRYIRSVVQRAQMESEVVKLVHEINAQNFDEVSKSRSGQLTAEDSQQILNSTRERLATLASEIPDRVGQHGSGATIVSQVLKRNIDKMKLINEMAAKLATASVAGAVNGVTA